MLRNSNLLKEAVKPAGENVCQCESQIIKDAVKEVAAAREEIKLLETRDSQPAVGRKTKKAKVSKAPKSHAK